MRTLRDCESWRRVPTCPFHHGMSQCGEPPVNQELDPYIRLNESYGFGITRNGFLLVISHTAPGYSKFSQYPEKTENENPYGFSHHHLIMVAISDRLPAEATP